jgi:hypothetical protein
MASHNANPRLQRELQLLEVVTSEGDGQPSVSALLRAVRALAILERAAAEDSSGALVAVQLEPLRKALVVALEDRAADIASRYSGAAGLKQAATKAMTAHGAALMLIAKVRNYGRHAFWPANVYCVKQEDAAEDGDHVLKFIGSRLPPREILDPEDLSDDRLYTAAEVRTLFSVFLKSAGPTPSDDENFGIADSTSEDCDVTGTDSFESDLEERETERPEIRAELRTYEEGLSYDLREGWYYADEDSLADRREDEEGDDDVRF